MAGARVTGVGIAIFNGGKIAYLKTYGERDTENHLPLTPNSIMTCASLSKPAFAVLVMELVRRGVIDLDKPVYEYLESLWRSLLQGRPSRRLAPLCGVLR
jgi:CubicO group peptidase (beta-lactamase class C family)